MTPKLALRTLALENRQERNLKTNNFHSYPSEEAQTEEQNEVACKKVLFVEKLLLIFHWNWNHETLRKKQESLSFSSKKKLRSRSAFRIFLHLFCSLKASWFGNFSKNSSSPSLNSWNSSRNPSYETSTGNCFLETLLALSNSLEHKFYRVKHTVFRRDTSSYSPDRPLNVVVTLHEVPALSTQSFIQFLLSTPFQPSTPWWYAQLWYDSGRSRNRVFCQHNCQFSTIFLITYIWIDLSKR